MVSTSAGERLGVLGAILRIAAGIALILLPLLLLKLIILPALGLRSGLPPYEAISVKPLEFTLTLAGNFVCILGGYAAYARYVDRRSMPELSLRGMPTLYGLASGVGLIGFVMVLLYVTGYYVLESVPGFRLGALAVVGVVTSIVLLEELVFRGMILTLFRRVWGAPVALVVQALLFAAAHVFNDNWSGLMPLVSTVLIGLFWGAIYLKYPNIWVIAVHHAVWNLTIFASGLPLSGETAWRPLAPLQSRMVGPELITGGLGGPELSFLTPVVIVLALVYLARSGREGKYSS